MKRKIFLSIPLMAVTLFISGCSSTQPTTAPKIFIDQGPAINSNFPQYYTPISQSVQGETKTSSKKNSFYTPSLHLSTGIGLGSGGIRFGGIGLGTGINIW